MKWLKNLLTNIWFYVVLLLLSIVIPFIINEIYKYGQFATNPYITMWAASDVFAFFGSYLSFFGSLVLGAVAVFQTEKANQQTEKANQLAEEALLQTEKANELASSMQKMEQAKFLSMVSLLDFYINERSIQHPDYRNHNILNPEIIDMVDTEYTPCSYCYHVDACIKNESDFPIVQINSHAHGRYDDPAVQYGILDRESSIYIPPKGTQNMRFLIPTTAFQKYDNETTLSLHLSYINIYGYATHATLLIENISSDLHFTTHSYRLNKILDITP